MLLALCPVPSLELDTASKDSLRTTGHQRFALGAPRTMRECAERHSSLEMGPRRRAGCGRGLRTPSPSRRRVGASLTLDVTRSKDPRGAPDAVVRAPHVAWTVGRPALPPLRATE